MCSFKIEAMLACLLFLCTFVATQSANVTTHHGHSNPAPHDYMKMISDLQKRIETVEKHSKTTMKQLARQMIMQQLFVEERIRSDGDSGLKQVRVSGGGTRPYYTNAYTSGGVASIHEHANYNRTAGMGEFVAVLNGVEFRTRHNDYKLKMPSTTSKDYNALEDIPFPPVPPSVLQKLTVQEQIAEMKEYFRAFHDQNTRVRNWKPYFKPIMCYLEGGWTTNTKTLEEPFQSDRHNLEAMSWFDLQEKIRYTSYTGGRSNNQNLSFLPTTIVNVTEDGSPIFAQWNYRIICHPIKTHFEVKFLKLVDDLAVRMKTKEKFSAFASTRKARFSVNPRRERINKQEKHRAVTPRGYRYGKLDEIMYEIPGKDNYNGYLTDDSFDLLNYRADTKNLTVLNTARYHRWYKVTKRGAMGRSSRKRGFSDDNMWTAKTSNPQIVESSIYDCYDDKNASQKICKTYKGRYTYAIPLEIIWLTPLSSWNPYNLTIHDRRHAYVVTDGGRNGDQKDKTKAFNGVSGRNYYMTPAEFFVGGEVHRDPADTAKDEVGVLDQHGQIQRVSASGIRVFLPEIPGVGKIRQRYPVMPIHQDGSAIWKNLEALQDITMDMKRYTYMFENRPKIIDLDAHAPDTQYSTTMSHSNPPGMHQHDLYITAAEMASLHKNGTMVTVDTTENNGHKHKLELQFHPDYKKLLKIVTCDGQPHCWDRHSNLVYKKAIK